MGRRRAAAGDFFCSINSIEDIPFIEIRDRPNTDSSLAEAYNPFFRALNKHKTGQPVRPLISSMDFGVCSFRIA
jgi:hypothetical protein